MEAKFILTYSDSSINDHYDVVGVSDSIEALKLSANADLEDCEIEVEWESGMNRVAAVAKDEEGFSVYKIWDLSRVEQHRVFTL